MACDDWGEIPETTATPKPPRRDALAAALKGIMPVDSPLTDPLWLTPQQQATREAVRAVIDRWKTGNGGGHDDYNYIEVPGRYSLFNKHEYVHVAHFIPAMERKAYELLLRGHDERSIAVDCYLTIDEVREVAERHGLQK